MSKSKKKVSDAEAIAKVAKWLALPKSETAKIKPGTWIRCQWPDAEDSAALVVKKMVRGPGERPVTVYDPVVGFTREISSAQVVRVIGPVVVPHA